MKILLIFIYHAVNWLISYCYMLPHPALNYSTTLSLTCLFLELCEAVFLFSPTQSLLQTSEVLVERLYLSCSFHFAIIAFFWFWSVRKNPQKYLDKKIRVQWWRTFLQGTLSAFQQWTCFLNTTHFCCLINRKKHCWSEAVFTLFFYKHNESVFFCVCFKKKPLFHCSLKFSVPMALIRSVQSTKE